MDTTEIVAALLASMGGTALIVGGLAGWIGKIWSDRIIEKEKARYANDLELLKTNLQLAAHVQTKISDARYDLYTEVWEVLQDLTAAGEELWKKADRSAIIAFTNILNAAFHRVRKGRLILKDDHYHRVVQCLDSFSQYRAGKQTLADIRDNQTLDYSLSEDHPDRIRDSIRNQIDNNRQKKAEYESLLVEIGRDFRQQLGL